MVLDLLVVNTQTTDLPVLIDIIRKTLPEGVQLSIHEHDNSHSEARYDFSIKHIRGIARLISVVGQLPYNLYYFHFRYIPDPLIDGLRDQITQYETKKQERIAEAQAEKAAKGKTK